MKLNYVGLIGAILAFVSVALPWWTFTINVEINASADLYLYQTSGIFGTAPLTSTESWFCWAAFALIMIGGVLGIVGSVTEYDKRILIGGGVFALLSLIIFVVGLQMWLLSVGEGIGIFTIGQGYATYLSYGFWAALVATILMLITMIIKPKKEVTRPLPATPPVQT